MVNGTSSCRARVWARRVLPVPVGPMRRMFDLASSTSSCLRTRLLVLDALVVVVDRHRQFALGRLLADHELVQMVLDLVGLGQIRSADLGLVRPDPRR
jgi:hypothetical protein